MQIGSTQVDSTHVARLSWQVNESSQEVVQHLESPCSRIINFFVKHFSSTLPGWAERHITLIHKLQQAILEAKSATPTAIPPRAIQSLSQGRKILHRLLPEINYDLYLQCIKPKGHFVDKHGQLLAYSLPKNLQGIAPSKFAWYQNLGLMMPTYNHCQDVQLKKKMAFLAFNYLAKSAPICPEDPNVSKEAKRKMSHLFQRSLPEPGISYNRESALFDDYFRNTLSQIFAPSSGNVFFLLDTPQIDELLPLGFSMIQTPASNPQESFNSFDAISEAWIGGFYDKILEHEAKHVEAPLDHSLDPPLLIDLTSLLEKHIHTCNDVSKNQAFEQRHQEIEGLIEKALDMAIHKHVQDENLRQKLKVWTLTNLTCICRCEVHGVGVLKMLPLFYRQKYLMCPPEKQRLLGYSQNCPENLARVLLDHKHTKSKVDMDNFLNATGLRLGSVKGRMKTFEAISLEDFIHSHEGLPVEYYPQGANSLYYPGRLDLFKTELVKRWEREFNAFTAKDSQRMEKAPYLKVLGKATLKLLKGLMQEISEARWRQLNQDPHLRELIQTCLYKIQVHVASAELHPLDFSKFTDAIELVHYEIATLLYLFAPFKAADFEDILKTSLGPTLPVELRKFAKGGITKSAMNTVAGLCAAVHKTSAEPVKAYHEGSHFEIVQFMHSHSSSGSQIAPTNLQSVDMYLGEFHHNVKLLYNHNEYQPGDVIGDVEPWIHSLSEGQHLTVAIDSTIDFIQSPQAQKVLEHFSGAIQEGKLNVVFFRSGQKFDMLGMDDYYGSAFYMLHNGAKHWEAFSGLLSKEAYQTDELSVQWFCLAYKYIHEELDAYRQLIFQNTRAILRQVPTILLPGGNANIKVAKVAEGMLPCFLDIKCYGPDAFSLVHQLQKCLFDVFTRHNIKIHARGGYGYFNPNVCLFPKGLDNRDDYATLRINPGIDAKETELFVEFLNAAAKLAAS